MREISLILLALSALAVAQNGTVNGVSDLNDKTYDSLEVNGTLTFKNLVVTKSIVTNGSVQGGNLKCQTLKTNGSADLKGLQAQNLESNGSFIGRDIAVTGKTELNGAAEIKSGKLNEVQISSEKSTIIDTKISGNIEVKKPGKLKSKIQILELKGKTEVTGNVTFEQDGELHLFDDAKVVGKISKAQVIRE